MKTRRVTFEVKAHRRGSLMNPGRPGVLLYVSPNDPWVSTSEFVTAGEARRMAALLLRAAEKSDAMQARLRERRR